MNEKLIDNLKREVKQIAEEAVTRKFIHADSTSITSLSAVVDAIVQHGVKRRAGGILPPCDSETILLKLAELSPVAEKLVRKLMGLDDDDLINETRVQASNENTKKTDLKIKKLTLDHSKLAYGKSAKFLWIRVALVEKLLARVIAALVEHSAKFYEPSAILADPVNGTLVANLLDGPCALDYSKMKTPDGRWSDPSADELVQRHRIHSGLSLRKRPIPTRRPQLAAQSPTKDEFVVAPIMAREHVESLHQNAGSVMLFGKNNVELQPASGSQWILGYLSLHQNTDSLLLKWTPNKIMSGTPDENQVQDCNEAITIDTLDVVYVHCHHKGDAERVMVLIAQDGVQRPPIRFPTTGSLMHFLERLESGLVPYGRLDPPLTNDNGTTSLFDHKTAAAVQGALVKQSFARDYVFRLVPSIKPEDIGLDSNLNMSASKKWRKRKARKSSPNSRKLPAHSQSRFLRNKQVGLSRTSLETVCETMRNQILNRALKGWASHVRHLSTVRKHLSSLVQHNVTTEQHGEPTEEPGVTKKWWSGVFVNKKLTATEDDLVNLVYQGGIEHELRDIVWPYLLGYRKFGSTADERASEDKIRLEQYNTLLTEWTGVEAIIHKRHLVTETDGDSTAGESTGSKEDDIFQDDEIVQRGGSPPSSETTTLCNGELSNSFGSHNGEQKKNARNSELDNESGCFDCAVEDLGSNPRLNSSMDKCSVCGLDILGDNDGVIGNGVIVNGCHDNGNDGDSVVGNGSFCSCNGDTVLSRLCPYTDKLLDDFALNIHRIDKDVLRCDRNYPYFTDENLEKLRRIMCTYVWNTLDIGYVQGMCDLLAPLLVIFDDEAKSYHCFVLLMKRMDHNFPHGGAMDIHFSNMRSLIQILDPELFEVMQQNGDLTHCYFCYRWFLLDFKREFEYDDIFRVWECIWAAQICSSKHFVLFIALALLKSYRNILIDHSMDFTDVIKFFNEMAERHNATQILDIARDSVKQVEIMIQNE